MRRIALSVAAVVALMSLSPGMAAQTRGEKEEFTAVAIVNNNLGSGVGMVDITVTRWSTPEEGKQLVDTLQQKGSNALLEVLSRMKTVGTIKTPDSLAYDLRYSHQAPDPEGGRRIVLATDRPIGFWEALRQPRTIDYPFTVIQMQMGADGTGKGTLSYATKIIAYANIIELENYATAPVMLTEIRSKKVSR